MDLQTKKEELIPDGLTKWEYEIYLQGLEAGAKQARGLLELQLKKLNIEINKLIKELLLHPTFLAVMLGLYPIIFLIITLIRSEC